MKALEITSQIGCPNQCPYCPQDVLIEAYRQRENFRKLSFGVYKRCIDKLPENIGICFAGFSEPFLIPGMPEMIEYASSLGKELWVNTTLVGLEKADIKRLAKISYKRFAIHLPTKGNPLDIDYDVLWEIANADIENIQFREHCESGSITKGAQEAIGKHKTAKISTISRAGNLTNGPKRKTGKLKPCQDFYKQVLLPNGDVALCCMDYGLKHILGNLYYQNYQELFEGIEYQYILDAMQDDSLEIICRYCERAQMN